MNRITRIANIITFAAATAAIAGVFYEGLELQWFDIVSILILIMDISFVIATVLNLLNSKNNPFIRLDYLSAIVIVIAVLMKVLSVPYPTITLVLWYFYILFLYGYRCFVKKENHDTDNCT